jgi:hypothetical protein
MPAGRRGWVRSARFDSPLDVDDVPEFHAARLMLLLGICGEGRTHLLRGRTKLAKLDFFVRYPTFLESALRTLRGRGRTHVRYAAGDEDVEAAMVRYHYGPWDQRYYDLLAMLTARGLLRIGGGPVETYSLTDPGAAIAAGLAADPAFAPIVRRCEAARDGLAWMTGTQLKEFVYSSFADEVANREHGQLIVDDGAR